MRCIWFPTCLFALIPLNAEDPPGPSVSDGESGYLRIVSIEPARAKDVPAMRITLATKPMGQTESGYESTYSVTVFPFFFFNETGSIRINLAPGILERLEAGEVVSFSGEAINQSNARRLIEGRAYPENKLTGRLRIVVKVGGIELIFKTTYRFTG